MVVGLLLGAFSELQKFLVVQETEEEESDNPSASADDFKDAVSGVDDPEESLGSNEGTKEPEEDDSTDPEYYANSDDDICYDCYEYLQSDSDLSDDDDQDVLITLDRQDEEIVNDIVENLLQSVTYFVYCNELCCAVEETVALLLENCEKQFSEEASSKLHSTEEDTFSPIELTKGVITKPFESPVTEFAGNFSLVFKEEFATQLTDSSSVEESSQIEESCIRELPAAKKNQLIKQHAFELSQDSTSVSESLIPKESPENQLNCPQELPEAVQPFQDTFVIETESEDSGFVENFNSETSILDSEDSTSEEHDEPSFILDDSSFVTYPKNLNANLHSVELSELDIKFDDEMALPRELMLIINDISDQNCHLLEWEVFGNSSEDMRVVLTWRKLDKKNQPRRHSQGKWKLRQSSITAIGDEEDDSSFPQRKHSSDNWEVKQKGSSDGRGKRQPYDEGEYKDRTGGSRKTSAAEGEDGVGGEGGKRKTSSAADGDKHDEDGKKKRGPYDEGEYKGRSKDDQNVEGKNGENKESDKNKDEEEDGSKSKNEEETNSNKSKKKNPFRKMTKEQKLKMKRNKLQLSFSSIDQDDDSSEISGDLNNNTETVNDEDEETKRKKRGPYDEGEYKDRSKGDDAGENETGEANSGDKEGKEQVDAKTIAGLADDEEEKRKRGVYDEGEYKKRSAEEDPGKQEENATVKAIAELDDLDGKRSARGEYDEGEYSHRRGSKVTEIEPVEMKDFDPSKRELFDDEACETSSTAGADITLEKPLEEISAEDIKGKKQAKKVLELQREKMQEAVDEPSKQGHEEVNGLDKKLTARELREANLLSLTSDLGTYDDGPMQKKLILPKPPKGKGDKETEEEEGINKHSDVARLKPTLHGQSVTGWERCVDCKYNSFCDDLVHKSEYMAILLNDRENDTVDTEACKCNVCNGGAVHNGCVYRELLRLKTEYRLFDKRNLCLCSVCIPFKYRKVCLRQELRDLRKDGIDLYYRLTYHGDDGKEGYHPNLNGYLEDSGDESEEEVTINGVNLKHALCLDDVDMEITQKDKIDFRNCIDCSFNGFCDEIRHKKLYLLLLRLDIEEFDELDEECSCMVCEFKGAAHSGCARREMIRLKYDLLLYDTRNLCYCPQCVPFKYRSMCLRQELKLLRRRKNIDLYCNL